METTIQIPKIPSARTQEEITTTATSNHFVKLSGTNELVFLEMQGSVMRVDEKEARLGRLVEEDDGRIYLLVGYQKLEGKLMTLKKPFAVLRRKDATTSKDTEDASQALMPEVAHMEVVDVCRKKLYFGSRPEPLNEMIS